MNSDVSVIWNISSGVPAKKVHVAEDLLELLLLSVVIVLVDDHKVAYTSEQQLERVHYFYIPAFLFSNQCSVNCNNCIYKFTFRLQKHIKTKKINKNNKHKQQQQQKHLPSWSDPS